MQPSGFLFVLENPNTSDIYIVLTPLKKFHFYKKNALLAFFKFLTYDFKKFKKNENGSLYLKFYVYIFLYKKKVLFVNRNITNEKKKKNITIIENI